MEAITELVLREQIQSGSIRDANLSENNLKDIDFSGCTLENIIFSTSEKMRIHRNLNFKGSKLINVRFDHASLISCNFDRLKKENEEITTEIKRCSFKNANLRSCRFRGSRIKWSDFRYAEIKNGTFESAAISFCDFYRAFFLGVVIFRKSHIEKCSLHYTHFDDSAGLGRENLKDLKILQEYKKDYRRFLEDWKTLGTGTRKNDMDQESAWEIEQSLKNRFEDAEGIYKFLNGFWTSRGLLGNANWAYVKGKRMERKNLWAQLRQQQFSLHSFKLLFQVFWNGLKDLMFGYGESIRRMIISYIIVVFLFAYIFFSTPDTNLIDYLQAIKVSLKNMVAINSNQLQNVSPFIDMLNVVQTTVGILLTGIFGFILGNKIRNQ
ncbi:MAG: pentapeptide repeat-containing protein [Bacteroidales bacterium]|nr:pentapeptide repeat-containing protein [Bacteroidales bacterium]MCF8388355.1 pentapeptide repeat-containing protein [Bacteroidales bacterium]MCF8399277.1 pentapeptide repeat-containing protein [Bacteroidales bacterium]